MTTLLEITNFESGIEIQKLCQIFGKIKTFQQEENKIQVSYQDVQDLDEALFNLDGIKMNEKYLSVRKIKSQNKNISKPVWEEINNQ